MTEKCSECGASSMVINSRPSHDTIRRRRQCVACGNRWSTYEILMSGVRDMKRKIQSDKDLMGHLRRSVDFAQQALDHIDNTKPLSGHEKPLRRDD